MSVRDRIKLFEKNPPVTQHDEVTGERKSITPVFTNAKPAPAATPSNDSWSNPQPIDARGLPINRSIAAAAAPASPRINVSARTAVSPKVASPTCSIRVKSDSWIKRNAEEVTLDDDPQPIVTPLSPKANISSTQSASPPRVSSPTSSIRVKSDSWIRKNEEGEKIELTDVHKQEETRLFVSNPVTPKTNNFSPRQGATITSSASNSVRLRPESRAKKHGNADDIATSPLATEKRQPPPIDSPSVHEPLMKKASAVKSVLITPVERESVVDQPKTKTPDDLPKVEPVLIENKSEPVHVEERKAMDIDQPRVETVQPVEVEKIETQQPVITADPPKEGTDISPSSVAVEQVGIPMSEKTKKGSSMIIEEVNADAGNPVQKAADGNSIDHSQPKTKTPDDLPKVEPVVIENKSEPVRVEERIAEAMDIDQPRVETVQPVEAQKMETEQPVITADLRKKEIDDSPSSVAVEPVVSPMSQKTKKGLSMIIEKVNVDPMSAKTRKGASMIIEKVNADAVNAVKKAAAGNSIDHSVTLDKPLFPKPALYNS